MAHHPTSVFERRVYRWRRHFTRALSKRRARRSARGRRRQDEEVKSLAPRDLGPVVLCPHPLRVSRALHAGSILIFLRLRASHVCSVIPCNINGLFFSTLRAICFRLLSDCPYLIFISSATRRGVAHANSVYILIYLYLYLYAISIPSLIPVQKQH